MGHRPFFNGPKSDLTRRYFLGLLFICYFLAQITQKKKPQDLVSWGFSCLIRWQEREDSNPRPLVLETSIDRFTG